MRTHIFAIPPGVFSIIPTLFIRTSSPLLSSFPSTSFTAFLMLSSFVTSSWMKTTLPSDFSTISVRSGDCLRVEAKIVPTSARGKEMSWLMMPRARPREEPVMR